MLYLGYGAVLVACVSKSAGKHWLDGVLHSWFGRGLAFIGFSSYSIYLWHTDLSRYTGRVGNWIAFLPSAELRWMCVTALYVITVVIGGVLIGKVVEMPGLAFRDRLFPARVATTQMPDVGR